MDIREQAIAGVIPPQLAEARMREAFPSVARFPGVASLGRVLTRTIILAPLAWMVMGFFYFLKVLPIGMTRYTLTNRRLMVRKGWGGKVAQEVPLADVDDVRVITDGNSSFFRAGTVEIVRQGQMVLSLPGVPEPDAFRHAIINACTAWVPGKAKTLPFIPASAVN
jgi:hypothetical protein